mgnify:CR=1 FL=1
MTSFYLIIFWLLQEAAIEDYFKPIDKQADIIMKMQLEGEERKMKDMMRAMQQQALLEKAEAEKTAPGQTTDINQQTEEKQPAKPSHAELRWFDMPLL